MGARGEAAVARYFYDENDGQENEMDEWVRGQLEHAHSKCYLVRGHGDRRCGHRCLHARASLGLLVVPLVEVPNMESREGRDKIFLENRGLFGWVHFG